MSDPIFIMLTYITGRACALPIRYIKLLEEGPEHIDKKHTIVTVVGLEEALNVKETVAQIIDMINKAGR